MEEYYMHQDNEVGIDLFDLFIRLLRHWRSLIAVILIGAVLGGGFGYIKASKNAKLDRVEDFSQYTVDADITKNMELASSYRKLYESQLKYNEHAILMKMDPNHLYQGNIRYYMKGGENTKLIAESFRMLLNQKNVREKLVDASGDVELEYLMEVIGCSIDLNVGYQGSVFNAGSDMYDLVVNYNVNFPDEESIIPVMKALKGIVQKNINDISAKYDDFTWEMVDDSLKEAVVPDYINRQKSSIDILNMYLSSYTKIESSFKGKDALYYKAVYLDSQEGMDDSETMRNGVLENPISIKTIIKWMLIITFLFCCVWGGVIFVSYLLDDTVKTADEFKDRYGLELLGYIPIESRHTGIDRLIDRLAEASKVLSNDENYVAVMKKSLNIDYIFEVGMDTAAGFIHENADTLKKAKAADGVIINARLNHTSHKQLDREIEVCRIQGITVLGVVCRE